MSLSHFNHQLVTRHRHNSTTTLVDYAKNKRPAGKFNDVMIQAGEQSIPTNRIVVALQRILRNNVSERVQQTISGP